MVVKIYDPRIGSGFRFLGLNLQPWATVLTCLNLSFLSKTGVIIPSPLWCCCGEEMGIMCITHLALCLTQGSQSAPNLPGKRGII